MNFTGLSAAAVLPVKLSDFGVKLVAGDKAVISWTTEQELNADRFEIERSNDGINWKSAGTVKAKGNSATAVKYNFTDASMIRGTVSYRLKMIDQDETSEYSAIRSVKPASSFTMSIYPNPATDYVVVNSQNGSSENISIQLINQNGQLLKQITGTGKVNFSVNEFNTGNYFIRVSDSTGDAKTFKLLVVR
jgi:hypothetical protein